MCIRDRYGLAPFITKCKESVWKYKGMWEDFSGTVGFWADMDNPYVTYDDNFIESEWWALKSIWDKGLLYKGFKIVPYCPRCGTPLSSHEVAQGYKAVKERSAIVRFKVVGEDAYFLAWTTTCLLYTSSLNDICELDFGVEEACLYSNFNHLILDSDGKGYHFNTYPDQAALNLYQSGIYQSIMLRSGELSSPSFGDCITVFGNVPENSADDLGCIIFNINKEKVFSLRNHSTILMTAISDVYKRQLQYFP